MPKFHLVPGAVLAPGVCGVCGNNKGQMVDTGAEVMLSAVQGRLYLCRQFCVPALCEVAGALNPAASKALREQAEMLERELAAKDQQVEKMRPIVHAVARAREMNGNEIGSAEVA